MESATLRAARCAASSLCAPRTTHVGHLGRPLGVVDHLRRERTQASSSAGPSAAGDGLAPRPLASTSTVSLVDVDPSTVIVLNDAATASASAVVQRGGVDRGVGRAQGEHGGHVRRQHGGTLGHAPHREPVADHDDLLAHGVGRHDGPGRQGGVVLRATACHDDRLELREDVVDGERDADQARLAHQDLVGDRTRSRRRPPRTAARRRRARVRRWRRWRCPRSRITTAAAPPVAARWARLTWTGAAAARLEVNTPAAGTARPSAVATTPRRARPRP